MTGETQKNEKKDRKSRIMGRKDNILSPRLPQSGPDTSVDLLPPAHVFFLDMFFFLDSFPGDPHLIYVMPTGEMEIRSPWTDRGNQGLEGALLGGVEGPQLDTPKEKSGRTNKHL